MNVKEFFSSSMGGAANLGASRFRISSDKEKIMTPHVIMGSVLDMLERRPSIKSGLNDLVRFLVNDIQFTSDDPKSVEFMRRWMSKRPLIETDIFNFVYTLVGVGTSYTQPFYVKRTNGEPILDNIKAVPDPSIIYRNVEADEDSDEYWCMEVPFEVRKYDGQVPRYRPAWYIKGTRFYHKHIWCIAYPKRAYDVATFGHSRNLPHYGWGVLSSAVDNEDIVEEIVKNWALQAKYRSLGKKIIGFYNSSDDPVSLQELEDIKKEFSLLEEEDSLIINKRFDQTDLSFQGQDSTMDQQIDWLRKDSGSGLVPNFMTAFSQDSSMATATEAKIPFGLMLKSVQPVIEAYLDKVIVQRLRKAYPFLAEDLGIVLGLPELYSREEVFNMMSQLYNMRACTFNELRKAAGLEAVKGGDVWGSEPPLDSSANTSALKAKSEEEQKLQEAFKTDLRFKKALKEMVPSDREVIIKAEVKMPSIKDNSKKAKDLELKESVQKAVKELLK